MAYTPKRLNQYTATTSYGTLYTVPAATSTIVKELIVCNVTGSTVTLDVSFVASGGSAVAATNGVISAAPIGANQTVIYSLSSVMATGGFISAKASAGSSLVLTVSGVEVT